MARPWPCMHHERYSLLQQLLHAPYVRILCVHIASCYIAVLHTAAAVVVVVVDFVVVFLLAGFFQLYISREL